MQYPSTDEITKGLKKMTKKSFFLSQQTVESALMLLQPGAKAILEILAFADNKFAVIAIEGVNYENELIDKHAKDPNPPTIRVIGDLEAAQAAPEVVEKYTNIALYKFNKTKEFGLPTGELVKNHPELFSEGEFLYPGSFINRSGRIAAVSGARGLVDEALAKTYFTLEEMIVDSSARTYISTNGDKNALSN
jgi:hypothetical protein